LNSFEQIVVTMFERDNNFAEDNCF